MLRISEDQLILIEHFLAHPTEGFPPDGIVQHDLMTFLERVDGQNAHVRHWGHGLYWLSDSMWRIFIKNFDTDEIMVVNLVESGEEIELWVSPIRVLPGGSDSIAVGEEDF